MNAESSRRQSAFVHITDILGDRWTPLVLCAAFLGLRRFDEIQSGLEIATNILTHRLNYLVDHRILERRQYSERPPRYEYRLTQKGRDLFPHALMLMQWGDRWLRRPAARICACSTRPAARGSTPSWRAVIATRRSIHTMSPSRR